MFLYNINNSFFQAKVPRDYPIHVHCFTGPWSVCQKWLNTFPGCVIGITAVVTKPAATNTHEVARRIPLERLVLETDSPYLLPKMVK